MSHQAWTSQNEPNAKLTKLLASLTQHHETAATLRGQIETQKGHLKFKADSLAKREEESAQEKKIINQLQGENARLIAMKKGLENDLTKEVREKNSIYMEMVAGERTQKAAEETLATTIRECRKELQTKVKEGLELRSAQKKLLLGAENIETEENEEGVKMDIN